MINVKYPGLEIGDLPVATAATIYEGTPVCLDATGYVTEVVTDVKVLGLSKVDKNSYRDLTGVDGMGDGGAYGSKKITVIMGPAEVQLYPSWYEQVDGTEVKVDIWTGTFDYNTELYVTTGGQICGSGDAVGTTNCNFGRVVEPPTVANGGVMVVLIFGA